MEKSIKDNEVANRVKDNKGEKKKRSYEGGMSKNRNLSES
jgi:hypothetical protein